MDKHVYFYDREQKVEFLGKVTSEKNYGPIKDNIRAIVREMLPKDVETFQLLKVERCDPMGSLFSNMISTDFTELLKDEAALSKARQDDTGLPLPDTVSFNGSLIRKDVLKRVNQEYLTKSYVELCLEHPKMYSVGQFAALIRYIRQDEGCLKSVGFFTPVNISEGQYYVSSKFCEFAERESIRNLCTLDSEALAESMNAALLQNAFGKRELPGKSVEVFEASSGIDIMLVSLYHLIQEQMPIKKCGNCGKFFVPLLRSDAIYCDRPAPQDHKKTCKEYGGRQAWYENMMNDDVTKTARNIYYAKRMLAKRNPDKPEYAEMFDYYSVERKRWESAVQAGAKTREEFAEWLRKMKLCKTKAELEES